MLAASPLCAVVHIATGKTAVVVDFLHLAVEVRQGQSLQLVALEQGPGDRPGATDGKGGAERHVAAFDSDHVFQRAACDGSVVIQWGIGECLVRGRGQCSDTLGRFIA